MLRYICLLFILHTVLSFPLPSFSNTDDCDLCACSVKNWVCNIKCPNQESGTRTVCGIEEYSQGAWVPSQVSIHQSANNFCQKAQIINEHSHLAVGNFFQQTEELDWESTLDCRSIRIGDETRRQKITFDLIPPIRENPQDSELLIFERANGTRDGLLEAHSNVQVPADNHLPEAFAVSLLVDGIWTKFFYFGVRGAFVEFKGQSVPDWKNQDMGYNMDYDSWSTELEFREFGLPEGCLASGISIINLQPGDMIRGPESSGELVFKENVETVCLQYGDCTPPEISQADKSFGPFDYDPDIVWIGPYTGQTVRKRNLH